MMDFNWQFIIDVVQSLLILTTCIIALWQFRRNNRLEQILKIALGEVDININMGDYINKNRKKILDPPKED